MVNGSEAIAALAQPVHDLSSRFFGRWWMRPKAS